MRTHFEFTQHDHDLVHHAARRGQVVLDNGCQCTLIAWRPTRARRMMRVQFANRKTATIPTSRLAEAVGLEPGVRDAS